MKIEYVTHASLLIKSEKVSLLTDPFFFLDKHLGSFISHFPPRVLRPSHFDRLDYVYMSHEHQDHCHKHTLLTLKDRIGTVLVPANKPDLEDHVRNLGFKKIIFLDNRVTVPLKGGIRATSFADSNGVDTALVVQTDESTVLHQNDCLLDETSFREMAKRFSIDYAFVPHTTIQELYPFLLSISYNQKKEIFEKREREGLEYFFKCLSILKPRRVIPYAYTILYTRRDQQYLNGFGRTLPSVFCKKLTQRYPEMICWVMQPGDVIDASKDKCHPYRRKNLWGQNISTYNKNVASFLKTHRYSEKNLPAVSMEEVEKGLFSFFADRLKKPFPIDFANQVVCFHITNGNQRRSYFLDTGKPLFAKNSSVHPFLEISMPALVMRDLLKREYDVFLTLYCYQIFFKLNIFSGLSLKEECNFLIRLYCALFDYEYYERVWGRGRQTN